MAEFVLKGALTRLALMFSARGLKSIRQVVIEVLLEQQKGRNMKKQLISLVEQMQTTGITYSEGVEEFKKRYILHVLAIHKGNQCKAARELRMHRNTLSRTIAELKLDVRQFRHDGRIPPSNVPIHDLEPVFKGGIRVG